MFSFISLTFLKHHFKKSIMSRIPSKTRRSTSKKTSSTKDQVIKQYSAKAAYLIYVFNRLVQ